jgi:hypothetical protein
MISFLIDTDKKILEIDEKQIKFDFPIYQIIFADSIFYILFHPGSDNRSYGQFYNLWGVNTEGKIIWKAELPDSSAGCFDRISIEGGKLHAYASTYDCIIDFPTGKIISSEFYK